MRRFALVVLLLATSAAADGTTPWANLAGLKAVSPNVHVTLNLQGAEVLQVEAQHVQRLVRSKLETAKLLGSTNDDLPEVEVIVTGKSTGGGGAEYAVEVLLTAKVVSPLAPDRNIQVIIWRAVGVDRATMSYDPKLKKLVAPPGSPKDSVNSTVEEVIESLINGARKANAAPAT